MTPPFAVLRVLARILAVPGEIRGTVRGTMAGGRDKRRDTSPRYAVVSTQVFACHCQVDRAVPWPKRLFCRNFHRAVIRRGSAAP